MTRREARMIAEELFRLQQADKEKKEIPEELLTMREAAAYTKRSYSYFQKNGLRIPRTKVGGRYYFTKESLVAWVNNRQ